MTNIYSSNSRLSYLIESIHFYYLFCWDWRRPLIIESYRVSKLLGTFLQLYLISRHFIPETFLTFLSLVTKLSTSDIVNKAQFSLNCPRLKRLRKYSGGVHILERFLTMGSSSSIVARDQVRKKQENIVRK